MKAAIALLLLGTMADAAAAQTDPPKVWVDASTGHRVVRISTEAGSQVLYFHQNSYSADGRRMVMATPSGISVVELASWQVRPLVAGRVGVIVTGRKTGDVYYTRDGVVFATNLETARTRQVVKLPPGIRSVSTLNCDETLLAGSLNEVDPTGATQRPSTRPVLPQRQRMFPGRDSLTPAEEQAARKEDRLSRRLANPDSMALFTLDTRTGEVKKILYQYAWLNHLQFSPTDPALLMFCHEGTWHEVDRIWTIRTDGTGLQLMHKRSMDMEIAGHEFWGRDGRTIWFDLQTPRSQVFWLAGVDVVTGKLTKYSLDRDHWSVHYNISPDGKMFCGDGGDPGQVAFANDGMWMNLFIPQPDGALKAERLVKLARNNYQSGDGEPNGSFTPDGRWVVFRSNMEGPMHVYAVEVAKADGHAS